MNLDDYVNAACAYGDGIRLGNSRLANKSASRVEACFRGLKKQAGWTESMRQLLGHPKEEVRLWAAAHLINYFEEEPKAALLGIIAGGSIVGLTAEITLERWKAGDLKY